MNHFLKKNTNFHHFMRDEKGLSTVEYLILLVLIAVAGITLWGAFGDAIEGQLGTATTAVEGLGGKDK